MHGVWRAVASRSLQHSRNAVPVVQHGVAAAVAAQSHTASLEADTAGCFSMRAIASAAQPAPSSPASSAVTVEASHTEGPGNRINPFSIVEEELSMLAKRMRHMVVSEVPKLAQAAEYFFKMGAEGKRFRPTVLLLMADAVKAEGGADTGVLAGGSRESQRRIAEITELIHVASLLHDDVLDHADTRRGVGSLNSVMGNKLAVLAGDFLLARASVSLASLGNTEVIQLLSKVLEHLVAGEIMQIAADANNRNSMDYYMTKTYYKTASLLANSCQSIAILGGQPPAVALQAFNYGRHLGLAYQLIDDLLDFTGTTKSLGKPALSDLKQGIATAPVLYAARDHSCLHELIGRKFSKKGDVDQALSLVGQSQGLVETRKLADYHASEAIAAIESLPATDSERSLLCRRALIDITDRVLTRSK